MDLLETLGLGARVPEENVVSYAIYTHQSSGASELSNLKDQLLGLVASHTAGFIWHKQPFQLQSSADVQPPWWSRRKHIGVKHDEQLPCLWGSVSFGDNIEDEWFIVWLLFHLSSQVSALCIQVWDNDGQFLLIEAAHSLPKWLKPETSTNRVWIKNGQLHIVPLPSSEFPQLPAYPLLADAVGILNSGQIPTHRPKVQQGLAARLDGFPHKAHQQLHRARCLVPSKVACMLKRDPQCVSAAVEAFYYRDSDDMKAAARMRHVPPVSMCPTLVTFNRCQYAQLVEQRYSPPRGFPHLPPSSHPDHKAADLGAKLCCGFEIVLSHQETAATSLNTQDDSEASVAAHPAWLPFKSSLQSSGYFRDNIPGSAEYKQLLVAAVKDFKTTDLYAKGAELLASPAAKSLPTTSMDDDIMPDATPMEEDDDSWLESRAADVEAELERRQQEMDAYASRGTKGPGPTEVDPSKLAAPFKDFLSYMSAGLEGAELPGQHGEVGLNLADFFKELGGALGVPDSELPFDPNTDDGSEYHESSSEGSSFFEGDGESDDSDEDADEVSNAQARPTMPLAAAAVSAKCDDTQKDTTRPLHKPAVVSRRQATAAQQTASAGDERLQQAPHVSHGPSTGPLRSSHMASKGQEPCNSNPDLESNRHAPCSIHPTADASAGTCTNMDAAGQSAAASVLRPVLTTDDSVLTGTDSDDDMGATDPYAADFMQAYDEALQLELQSTKVAETFERAADVAHSGNGHIDKTAGADMAQLTPVDLDVNLVKNLIMSYTSQQGMSGPASNLAGLLGTLLPQGDVQ